MCPQTQLAYLLDVGMSNAQAHLFEHVQEWYTAIKLKFLKSNQAQYESPSVSTP